jgi:hypothetical protein
MNYRLKMNQVKEVLGMEIKFEAITLVDGTKIEVEKFEPGFVANIVAEDGSMSPAPEGKHILEDGRYIEVDANGIIMEISQPEEEELAPEEAVVEVAGSKKFEDAVIAEEMPIGMAEVIKEKVAEIVEEKMKMAFEAITEVADEVAKVKEEMAAFSAKFNKFSKAPAAGAPAKVVSAIAEKLSALDTKTEFLKGIMSK